MKASPLTMASYLVFLFVLAGNGVHVCNLIYSHPEAVQSTKRREVLESTLSLPWARTSESPQMEWLLRTLSGQEALLGCCAWFSWNLSGDRLDLRGSSLVGEDLAVCCLSSTLDF